jgi:hypothetical protein
MTTRPLAVLGRTVESGPAATWARNRGATSWPGRYEIAGWLPNEAPVGRGSVSAWLERGEQHLH